ncbi:MAG: response regulator transcription factor [Chitinophagaceae bacterium]
MSTVPHKILVVDDDPDISMMLKMMLEFKGYKVSTAERADDTHATLRDDKIDLVIMDMLLSGVNGTDICTDIKKNEKTRCVPVMMISAHPNARELCLEAGADDFISKPFDMNEILGKISNLIK